MSDLHMFDDYESFYSKIEDSAVFSKYCETVYGIDLSQDGFADIGQITDLLAALQHQPQPQPSPQHQPLLVPGAKMLDIGCGNGKFCEYVRKQTGVDVYGFDYSPSAIASAKKRFANQEKSTTQSEHFIVAAIDSQDYPSMSFDAVVSIDTLYFTDNLDALINRIMRWLKPGGIFAAYYMDDNNRAKDETELAKTLCANTIAYEATDYSESHFRLMRMKHDTVLAMQDELERGGLGEHTKRMLNESFDESVTLENFKDKYCGVRYLFIVRKPDDDFESNETLLRVLSKMFGASVTSATCYTKQLHGGTVGEVRLVEGIAVTGAGADADSGVGAGADADSGVGAGASAGAGTCTDAGTCACVGEKLPYKVVQKIQKKWIRHGDPDSWRREYDLYVSDLGEMLDDKLRWPICYHAEMNREESETQIWTEYIDGASGYDLTVEMFERAAYELGRFQGKLYAKQPAGLQKLTNLSKHEDLKNYYLHYRSWEKLYNYIRSDDCEIPRHLCEMLIAVDENADEIWERIEKLPIVLCHRDFWVTNIFYVDGKIRLIDWDTSGWGYLGEDLKSLIADEADVSHMVEYYQKCVPAYYKGFSEYADISFITDDCVYEMILVNLGYRLAEWHMCADSPESKALQVDTLQKIYEMKNP